MSLFITWYLTSLFFSIPTFIFLCPDLSIPLSLPVSVSVFHLLTSPSPSLPLSLHLSLSFCVSVPLPPFLYHFLFVHVSSPSPPISPLHTHSCLFHLNPLFMVPVSIKPLQVVYEKRQNIYKYMRPWHWVYSSPVLYNSVHKRRIPEFSCQCIAVDLTQLPWKNLNIFQTLISHRNLKS